ncbi:MAG: glycosyltransferase [Anaerolineales bacterium]|nr:glycosyltransferase [Anaerolineales bacterium]
MNKFPLVSIVTPSLNQSRYIRSTIESVLNQDYPNLEYWVIDGGSNDGTVEILKEYNGRISWISKADNGQSEAINKGWMFSHGDILAWVNADDLLMPSAIHHAVNALLADQTIGAIYGNASYINETNNFIQAYPAHTFSYDTLVNNTENYIPQPSVFIRRNIIEAAGFLDESLHYLMDYDLWLRIGLITSMKHLSIDMASLRLHSSAKTINAMPKFANEFVRIYQKLFTNSSIPAHLTMQYLPIMHKVHVHAASFCFWGGMPSLAIKHLRNAWTLQPFPRNRTFWLLLAFSIFGKVGWRFAEFLHGNPMHLKRGILR